MKTPEELQEEAGMDDIYEIWSGQEDTDSLRESMRDTGTSGEMVYELPRRFGKKRLTESQLISMINTTSNIFIHIHKTLIVLCCTISRSVCS